MDAETPSLAGDGPCGAEPPWQRVGPDRVLKTPAGLSVEAVVEMPEWRASRFRPTAVFFEGERFAVRSHRPTRGGRHLYELSRWSDDGVEQPGAVIEYGEAYVHLRQRLRSVGRIADVLAVAAVPCRPLLGLLPARAKAALHGTLGVHPVEATRASIILECVAASLCAALATIHFGTGGALTPELVHTLWLGPLLGLDAFVRYGAVLGEELHPPGFLEWLVPARFRRTRAEGEGAD